MSNLFSEQVKDRTRLDREMYRTAEGLINDSITKRTSNDALGRLRTNEAALARIMDLCGISEEQLNHLEEADILFTSLEKEEKWYRYQTGYCIGKDAEGNYTAILPSRISGYYYIDNDADGKTKKHRINKKNYSRFTRVYCLCRLLPDKTLTIFELLKYVMSYMRNGVLAFYILISVAAGILGLVFPRLVSSLMDETTIDKGIGYLIHVAMFCIIAELMRLMLNVILAFFESRFTNRITCNIKNAVLIRYLSLTDNSSYDASGTWNAINLIVPEFMENLVSSGLSIIPHLIFILCYCIAAVIQLKLVSLWMFLILAILGVALWFVNKGFDKWHTKTIRSRMESDHMLFQVFKGIEKIWSREAQNRIYLNWVKVYADEVLYNKRRRKYVGISTGIHDFITPLLTVVLVGAAVFTSDFSSSAMLTGTLLAGLLAGQVTEVAAYLERIFNSKSLWQTISFLFEKNSEEKKVQCTEFSGDVKLEKVSFAYPGMEKLLDNISFEVKRGEYVGIVGISGCGKSTLLKLILGILSPDRGEISFGRYDLSDTDQRSILRNIGIVLQNESLIPGTIRQNLMMQPRPVTEEEIWETLEIVGIADLVRSYPYGLDTEISVSGSFMSGGQMQKLLIARAIISKPKMIVFDEATSALDNVSQKEIKEALDAMKCTRIMVAHRLSTVKDCDRIILLEKGQISQQGTYEELAASNDLFRELIRCQGVEVM